MKFLLNIRSDSELITYEAIALAFVLASFDHSVQLYFNGASHSVLTDPTSRLYGMVQSLDLYDLPMAWARWDGFNINNLDDEIRATLTGEFLLDDGDFDSILTF